MTDKEIIRGNKLIAKFDGWKKQPDFINGDGEKFPYYIKIVDGEEIDIHHHPDGYHEEWRHLMPVVEKIGKDYDVRITWVADGVECTYIERPNIEHDDTPIADFGGYGSLMNTFMCVVKFIEWYSQKNKKKKKK